MAANNILRIKTSRFPDYIYNLDPERYKDMRNKILKIDKAKNSLLLLFVIDRWL